MESKITMKIPGYVTCVKLSAENCDKMEKTFNEFDRVRTTDPLHVQACLPSDANNRATELVWRATI